MKVLTADQMRQVDLRTIAAGIPGLVLMENAGHRVVELIEEKFAPLGRHRVVVICGKGNNGGDGFVVARQLYTRLRPRSLHVVFPSDPAELTGEAKANHEMLGVVGCPVEKQITAEMRCATLVVDALLGTGLTGAARGMALDLIREMNTGFPDARVVAVDIPSGLSSDAAAVPGEAVRADFTVTFTAPKVAQVLPPACEYVGELRVGHIGSPPSLYEEDDSIYLSLSGKEIFCGLFAPRERGSHKGSFGHVLIVGGARGKSGAAAMSASAALRAGAGLVTVATAASAADVVASYLPEIMTEPLPETEAGSISPRAFDYDRMASVMSGKSVLAAGPGLGAHPETFVFARRVLAEFDVPSVVDADALSAIAAHEGFQGRESMVLTPHPGEMARLSGLKTAEVQADRVGVARGYATGKRVCLVLKGQRTLVARPDGRVWVNPTGTPAMATGGSGDILTGLIAGLMAQFPEQAEHAVLAAVWLHGRAGELGAAAIGEKPLTATDLLRFLPSAIEECATAAAGRHGPDQL